GVAAEPDGAGRVGQLVEQVKSDPAGRCTPVEDPDLPRHPALERDEGAVLQGIADRGTQRPQPGYVDLDEVRGQRLSQREERRAYVDPLEVVGLRLRDH